MKKITITGFQEVTDELIEKRLKEGKEIGKVKIHEWKRDKDKEKKLKYVRKNPDGSVEAMNDFLKNDWKFLYKMSYEEIQTHFNMVGNDVMRVYNEKFEKCSEEKKEELNQWILGLVGRLTMQEDVLIKLKGLIEEYEDL